MSAAPNAPIHYISEELKNLRSVEEGVRPEARQHKTGAIGRGLARARDVEFERGHAESSAQRTIAQRAQPRVRDTKTEAYNLNNTRF